MKMAESSPNGYKTLWGKEEIARNDVLYPLEKLSAIFIKFQILVFKPFQFGRVKNLLFGKGLNFIHAESSPYMV